MSRKNKHFRSERERILIHYARKHIGKPYVYGAKDYHAPRRFDCSSFLQYCFRRAGIELPRVTIAQAEEGREIRIVDLRAGDAIFTRGSIGRYSVKFPNGIGHVALYAGNGMVIHAEGIRYRKVVKEPLQKFLGRSKLTVIKRYF